MNELENQCQKLTKISMDDSSEGPAENSFCGVQTENAEETEEKENERKEEEEKNKRTGRDLWKNIKLFYRHFKKTQVIPEAFQIEEKPLQYERVEADPDKGLTTDQVQERINCADVNTPVESPSKSKKEIIYSNVFTYFNLIFVLIAILLCMVGSFRDLTFLPVILSNTLIGIIQELRSKKVLDDLNLLSEPKVTVVRNGQKQEIAAENLVTDDIVILQAGNQIVADACVAQGSILVNESLITGEADQIEKKKGDTLLSGSFTVSGECRARVEKVGKDSYVSKLTLEAKMENEEEISEMIRALNRLVKCIGILIIPIGIILFSQQYLINGSNIKESVTATVAAIIGMIPEGLYLLASVALAVSVVRLAGQKVLVHNMKCIETLARVDVLCVDKTGTITDNTMTVKKMILLRKKEASENKGETKTTAPEIEKTPKEELEELELALGDFAAAMANDNITMKAVKDFFRKRTGKRPERVIPFSSAVKYSAAVFEDGCYVMGAPEFVLKDSYADYEAALKQYSSQGYRVLVFGEYKGEMNGKPLEKAILPRGIVLLSNPIRKNAKETFAYFARQGVKIKVISGDNPLTVSEVAKEAGIMNAECYIDASQIKEDEYAAAVRNYTVFGRVTPEQKRRLVTMMQHQGHTVAMTGDGVNDVLALKEADCSIAMASGSDAAAQVSQIVLLESDFSKMPSVVAEGRRVVNNIERTASLFLVKNIFSLLMSIFSIVLLVNYPLEPSQISLISAFTIGIPAFLMSQEKNTDQIRGHFLSNVLFKALPGGLTDFLVVSGLYLFCMEFRVNESDVATSCTIILAIVGLMILYQIASPMTKFHWGIWIGMAAGLVYCMVFVSSIFAISSISKKCMMLLVIFAMITEPIFRYSSIAIRRISQAYLKKKNKC